MTLLEHTISFTLHILSLSYHGRDVKIWGNAPLASPVLAFLQVCWGSSGAALAGFILMFFRSIIIIFSFSELIAMLLSEAN